MTVQWKFALNHTTIRLEVNFVWNRIERDYILSCFPVSLSSTGLVWQWIVVEMERNKTRCASSRSWIDWKFRARWDGASACARSQLWIIIIIIIIIIIMIIIVTANRRRKVQQRRSSKKVEPKAYNGASGSRYTVHVWPWSTAYSQLESAVCRFLVREENRKTRRKTLEAEKRTNSNSTHLWRRVRESNPGHIGGRRALSPLHHPCFP